MRNDRGLLVRLSVFGLIVMFGLGGLVGAAPTLAQPVVTVRYVWPVSGTIVDPFRPPPHKYGPGNRGIELATVPRAAVRSPAIGVVTFAGQVGGTLWVVITHADGIRTTIGRLEEILVDVGANVDPGSVIGVSGGQLYFGARRGDDYIDPLRLLQPDPRPWLIPIAS